MKGENRILWERIMWLVGGFLDTLILESHFEEVLYKVRSERWLRASQVSIAGHSFIRKEFQVGQIISGRKNLALSLTWKNH